MSVRLKWEGDFNILHPQTPTDAHRHPHFSLLEISDETGSRDNLHVVLSPFWSTLFQPLKQNIYFLRPETHFNYLLEYIYYKETEGVPTRVN